MRTLDFGVFKLKTPENWKKLTVKGIDSYAGGLTNKSDTLWFDYGSYTVNLWDEDSLKYKLARDTINGLRAEIVIPKIKSKGIVSLFIHQVKEDDKFTMYAKDVKDTEIILKIFKSITFENSDTLVNPPLTENKFSEDYYSADKLYKVNCSSCHQIVGDMTGPALRDIFRQRSKEWVYRFLTRPRGETEDLLSKTYKLKFESRCMSFPRFKQDEVNAIYRCVW